MTASTGAFSFGDYSARESLWGSIKDLDALNTHIGSTSGTVEVSNKVHSWPIDPITATSAQAGTVELTDTSYAATSPSVLTNMTQIIENGFRVASTMQNTKTAGYPDKFAREQVKAMKMWKNQLEFSALAGSLVSGTGTAARQMKGIAGFASTLASTLASGVSLTSAMLNAYLLEALNVGDSHDTVLVDAELKSRISMFTENNTRMINAKDAELVGRVDYYNSDGGRVKIIFHRYVDDISAVVTHGLVTYKSDYIMIGHMDEPHYEDRPNTGYFKSGSIVGESTIQVCNEKAVGVYKLVK